mmetsp:Transcript_49389/g.138925  ORF Transcript_49389/g.138925 Transcript_49389/m.138925 type:complete len:341 (-) Transcript_49389:35-1057(-)
MHALLLAVGPYGVRLHLQRQAHFSLALRVPQHSPVLGTRRDGDLRRLREVAEHPDGDHGLVVREDRHLLEVLVTEAHFGLLLVLFLLVFILVFVLLAIHEVVGVDGLEQARVAARHNLAAAAATCEEEDVDDRVPLCESVVGESRVFRLLRLHLKQLGGAILAGGADEEAGGDVHGDDGDAGDDAIVQPLKGCHTRAVAIAGDDVHDAEVEDVQGAMRRGRQDGPRAHRLPGVLPGLRGLQGGNALLRLLLPVGGLAEEALQAGAAAFFPPIHHGLRNGGVKHGDEVVGLEPRVVLPDAEAVVHPAGHDEVPVAAGAHALHPAPVAALREVEPHVPRPHP